MTMDEQYLDLTKQKEDNQQEKVKQVAPILLDYLKLKNRYKVESDYSIIELNKNEKIITYQSKSNLNEKLKAQWHDNRWINLESNISDDKLRYFKVEIAPKIEERLEEKNKISKKIPQLKRVPNRQRNSFRDTYPSGKFPNENLISLGIEPPSQGNYSHRQASDLIEWKAKYKEGQVRNIDNLIREELSSSGYSPEIIRNKENLIHKLAKDKVEQNWNRNIEKLQEKHGIVNSGTKREISFVELKQWYRESKALERSDSHINQIKSLIENSSKSSVKLNESDYQIYRAKRGEFNNLDPKQQQTKLNQIGISFSSHHFGIKTNNEILHLNELKTWKREAKALGKSKEYLQQIDRTIKSSPISRENNRKTVSLKQGDYQLFQQNNSEFKKMQQEQNNSKTVGIGRFFSR